MLRELIKAILRSRSKRDVVGLVRAHGAKQLPQKSKGMPGVSRRVTPKRPTYKVGSNKWKQQVSDDVRDITRKYKLGPEATRTPSPFFNWKPVNPLKAQTLARLSGMKGRPGIARGLQRLEARKASALNTPGTPREGRPLRYEATIPRAANFNSLLARDRGFRDFLTKMVGSKKVADISPQMKDGLAKVYISLKRRGGKDY